jgi:hypothetical protein
MQALEALAGQLCTHGLAHASHLHPEGVWKKSQQSTHDKAPSLLFAEPNKVERAAQ